MKLWEHGGKGFSLSHVYSGVEWPQHAQVRETETLMCAQSHGDFNPVVLQVVWWYQILSAGWGDVKCGTQPVGPGRLRHGSVHVRVVTVPTLIHCATEGVDGLKAGRGRSAGAVGWQELLMSDKRAKGRMQLSALPVLVKQLPWLYLG